jgi:hypothetical protein
MGLLPQTMVVRFLVELGDKYVRESAKSLLSAFLESTGTQRVQSNECDWPVKEASKHLADIMFTPIDADDDIIDVANKGVDLHISHGIVSYGVSFGVDRKSNPKSRWNLLLFKVPFPILELRTFHGGGFKLGSHWAKSLSSDKNVDMVWLDGKFGVGRKTSYATGDVQYLFWKRRRINSSITVDPAKYSINAWLELRRICKQAWTEQHAGGHFQKPTYTVK